MIRSWPSPIRVRRRLTPDGPSRRRVSDLALIDPPQFRQNLENNPPRQLSFPAAPQAQSPLTPGSSGLYAPGSAIPAGSGVLPPCVTRICVQLG